mmetsp:Transcript_63493/g.204620  ORF Transcript_63493/g.204620 Transcript_63493/m.204620 type:complete len:211 (+) Transcript_63493:329-961(+)
MRTKCLVALKGELAHLLLTRVLQAPGEPKLFHGNNDVPAHIDLPPFEPMADRLLEGVVVVVPALAHGKQADKPVVHGEVIRVPVTEAPHMADRVHCSSHVPHPDSPCEEAPQHHWPPAELCKQSNRDDDGVHVIPLGNMAVEPLGLQVLYSVFQRRYPVVLCLQLPAHVGPPKPIKGRMHVCLFVCDSVVLPVPQDPLDRMPLEGDHPEV